jgi:hypothetical protein
MIFNKLNSREILLSAGIHVSNLDGAMGRQLRPLIDLIVLAQIRFRGLAFH